MNRIFHIAIIGRNFCKFQETRTTIVKETQTYKIGTRLMNRSQTLKFIRISRVKLHPLKDARRRISLDIVYKAYLT